MQRAGEHTLGATRRGPESHTRSFCGSRTSPAYRHLACTCVRSPTSLPVVLFGPCCAPSRAPCVAIETRERWGASDGDFGLVGIRAPCLSATSAVRHPYPLWPAVLQRLGSPVRWVPCPEPRRGSRRRGPLPGLCVSGVLALCGPDRLSTSALVHSTFCNDRKFSISHCLWLVRPRDRSFNFI